MTSTPHENAQRRRAREDLDILLVADDAADRALLRTSLAEVRLGESGAGRCSVWEAGSLAEALAAVAAAFFDVIVLDLRLPDVNGPDGVKRLLSAQNVAPVVAFADRWDAAAGLAAVRCGAQALLGRDGLEPATLGRTLLFAVERHRQRRKVAIREREVAASEERLRRLIAASPDGIVITDRAGVVVFANPAAETLFSRPRSTLIGSPLGLPVDGSRSEMVLYRPDGRPLTAELHVAPIEWLGRPGHLANFRDITVHKQTLLELDDARLRQIMVRDQFLAHVSHELRTPITVAEQWITLLHDGLLGPTTPEQTSALATARRNCRHLEKLIEDLLEAQRSESGKLRVEPLRTDLRHLVEEAIATVHAAQRDDVLRFRADLPDDLPDLLADPGRVRQVLVNLLGNAAKFTPAGGTVSVTAGPEPHVPDQLRVSVRDTGCGIPPDEHERIFEHLYQREMGQEVARKGLGLGLYICRQIVTQHGGRIWADSEVGRGSTFHFTVPVFSCRALLDRLPEPPGGHGALCLVSIDARPADGAPLQAFEARYLDAARRVAGECLLPDRDLLLPRLVCDQHGELMFIVAAADAAGAAVLVDRLRRQLAGAGDAGGGRLEFRLDAAPLPTPAPQAAAAGDRLHGIAAVLEAELKRMTVAAGRLLPG
ncbi:PAS domain S-box protein [bacterium]|nr:PAS domain S-box protein [bacterium]